MRRFHLIACVLVADLKFLDGAVGNAAEIAHFPCLLHGHRHQIAIEISDDPDRTGDDEKDDQHAKRKRQNIIRAVGPAAQMQKEDEMDADLR